MPFAFFRSETQAQHSFEKKASTSVHGTVTQQFERAANGSGGKVTEWRGHWNLETVESNVTDTKLSWTVD